MKRDNMLARVMLVWVALGHLASGLPLLFSGEGGMRIAQLMYGASFEPHAQAVYLVRPLGVYLLAMGLLQLRAAADPWRLRAVIDVTLLIFVLRQLQRVFWAPAMFETFGLTPARHWTATAVFFATLVLLAVARVKLKPPQAALAE
jgi:hypothetical protein